MLKFVFRHFQRYRNGQFMVMRGQLLDKGGPDLANRSGRVQPPPHTFYIGPGTTSIGGVNFLTSKPFDLPARNTVCHLCEALKALPEYVPRDNLPGQPSKSPAKSVHLNLSK